MHFLKILVIRRFFFLPCFHKNSYVLWMSLFGLRYVSLYLILKWIFFLRNNFVRTRQSIFASVLDNIVIAIPCIQYKLTDQKCILINIWRKLVTNVFLNFLNVHFYVFCVFNIMQYWMYGSMTSHQSYWRFFCVGNWLGSWMMAMLYLIGIIKVGWQMRN